MSRVRTNIEIEDTYLQAIMDRYGVRTKTEAVDLALRHLAGQPMSKADALAMRGAHAIGKLPADSKPPSSWSWRTLPHGWSTTERQVVESIDGWRVSSLPTAHWP
jgi:Arc/MetJ family transcription regulator